MKKFCKRMKRIGIMVIAAALLFSAGCGNASEEERHTDAGVEESQSKSDAGVEESQNKSYAQVNDNQPYFTAEDMTTDPFETYSELDEFGRCGVAYANICREIMPKEEREAIGQVKPSGWHTVKYPEYIKDRYLYNRCHLIAYCLAGENANEKNLITGTRYMNVEGMLPFEEKVADYVDRTGNHVLYRVTPDFEGENLVASGVLMEAKSVEDDGEGIEFCVYCYNVQPGIVIDYATGDSRVSPDAKPVENTEETQKDTALKIQENNSAVTSREQVWIPAKGGTRYHKSSSCSNMKNPRQVSRKTAEQRGYTPCRKCY